MSRRRDCASLWKWKATYPGGSLHQGGGVSRRKASLLVCGDGDLFKIQCQRGGRTGGVNMNHNHRDGGSRDTMPLSALPAFRESQGGGCQEVVFGVDATDLASSFPDWTFDRPKRCEGRSSDSKVSFFRGDWNKLSN